MKFPSPLHDGDWFRPRRKGHIQGCCDCGLVHRKDFLVLDAKTLKPVKGVVVLCRAFRDSKLTAQLRRQQRKK